MPIDCENGFTRLANGLIEELARLRIPGEAMQVLWVIIRKTYGFNKKSDKIALSQFVGGTGLNKPAVCRAINKLKDMGIVVIEKDNGVIEKDNGSMTKYGLNKVSEEWRPLSKKITLSKKIIGVIKKDNSNNPEKPIVKTDGERPEIEKVPLSKKIHTKDNTKDNNTKDNSTPKKSKPKSEISEIPESLQTDEFVAAWQGWVQHRTEIRKKLTPSTARLQLKTLSTMGASRAAAAINYSIMNGYTGIFEDKNAPKDDDSSEDDWMDADLMARIDAANERVKAMMGQEYCDAADERLRQRAARQEAERRARESGKPKEHSGND